MDDHSNLPSTLLDPHVEADHATLFELLEGMAVRRRPSDAEELNHLVDGVIEHAFDHFAREEALMAREAYPEHDRHARTHQHLRATLISDLRQVVHDRLSLSDFITRTREAFEGHVAQEDHAYGVWRARRPPVVQMPT